MIPSIPGAAVLAYLLIALAAVVGAGLLAWWAWRLWSAHKGRPRPPMQIWQWVIAIVLSLIPVSTAVMMAELALRNHESDKQIAEQERLMHITLTAPVAWGDITLPAGSHVERDMPEGGVERPDGTPDLRGLRDVRFAQPVPVGGMRVNALSIYNQLVFELAQPQRFAAKAGKPAENCPAGYMAQFNVRGPERSLNESLLPRSMDALQLEEWEFDSCYQAKPISVRYWKNGVLDWAEEPVYRSAQD